MVLAPGRAVLGPRPGPAPPHGRRHQRPGTGAVQGTGLQQPMGEQEAEEGGKFELPGGGKPGVPGGRERRGANGDVDINVENKMRTLFV